MFVIKPTADEEHNFKTRFKLAKGGSVIRMNDDPCASYMLIEKHKYSVDFVRQLLAGMSPDISNLFEEKEDGYYRSQDAVWGKDKGTKITGKVEVCGRTFLLAGDFGSTNMILPVKEEPEWRPIEEPKEAQSDDNPFLIVPPLEVVRDIHNRFSILKNVVVRRSDNSPCGKYMVFHGKNYAISFVKSVLLGNRAVDVSDLFEKKEDGYYRSQDPVWGGHKGTKVKDKATVCGTIIHVPETQSDVLLEAKEQESRILGDFLICPSPEVIEAIKTKFALAYGKVIYRNGSNCAASAVINGSKYSMGFVADVLNNVTPDISNLFEEKEDGYYRSQDPVWSTRKGSKVQSKTNICGVRFFVTPKEESLVEGVPYSYAITPTMSVQTIPSTSTVTVDGIAYPREVVVAAMNQEPIDLGALLFVVRDGELYRNNHGFWGPNQGKVVRAPSKICGLVIEPLPLEVEPDTSVYEAKPSTLVLSYIKNRANSSDEFINIAGKTIAHTYPKEYVQAVLDNKKPNLSILFNLHKGERVRNNHPIWDKYAGKKTRKSHYQVAGESVPVLVSSPYQEVDRHPWLKDVEVLEDGNLKITDQVGKIFNIGGIVYTRPYILSLREQKPLGKYEGGEMYLFRRFIKEDTVKPLLVDDVWGNNKLRWVKENNLVNDRIYTREQITRKVLSNPASVKEYSFEQWASYWRDRIQSNSIDGEYIREPDSIEY